MKQSLFVKRILSAALALIMGLSAVSCATGGPEADTTAAPNSIGTEPVTEFETAVTDSLPELDFDKEEFVFFTVAAGADLVGEVDGNVVSAAIYERNAVVAERLNIELTILEDNSPDSMEEIRRLILADDDSLDVVSGMQYRALPHAYEGLYRDLSEEIYLDWEKPWWASDYMDTIEWNDARYVLMGDISMSMLQNMSATFVNKRIFESAFGSIDGLYQTVFEGKWTYEKLTAYITEIYQDLNNNGKTDEGDILGLRTYHESPTDHMAYAAGMELTRHEPDGTVSLIEDQSRNIEIAETIYKLCYETPGVYLSLDFNTFTEHVLTSFCDGETLFNLYLVGTAEHFRDMDDPYAIITHPKLNEGQKSYHTLIHDTSTVFAVPITVDDAERHSAVLEAMCYESYRSVTPVYYDLVLKSRYSQDPSSAQAIDMIRANVRTDFIYANNYVFGQNGQLGTINRVLIQTKNTNYASTYRRYSKAVQRELDKINAGNFD